jgi:hypothetical protein
MTLRGLTLKTLFRGSAAIAVAALILFQSHSLPAETARRVVAYYFHTTLRCSTCLLIEERAGEVLGEAFAGEIADGLLQWQPVNVQSPENRHYFTEMRVRPKSLTLVEYYGDVPTEKKELPEVWKLIHDQPETFRRYLVGEVRPFLTGSEDRPSGPENK